MGARDARIDAVVDFFGPTDFFDPWVRDIVEDALAGDLADLPGLRDLHAQILVPLRDGDIDIGDARHLLLRRSARWFADALPRVQVHHGAGDPVVSVSQTQRLDEAMAMLGRGAPDYQSFIYPGGDHNPLTLPGSLARAATFLETAPALAAQRN
jgi:hypothetical protein